jgi:hypothetical protein
MKTTMVYRGVNMYSATELGIVASESRTTLSSGQKRGILRILILGHVGLIIVRFRITHNSTEAGQHGDSLVSLICKMLCCPSVQAQRIGY